MLPVFTITFIIGLLLGSYLPYFPFSVVCLLIGSVGLLTVLEIRGLLAPGRSQVLFACVAGGCLYWTLYAWLTPHAPIPREPEQSPCTDFEGTIVRGRPSFAGAVDRPGGGVTPSTIPRPPSRSICALPGVIRTGISTVDCGFVHGPDLHAPAGTLNPKGFDYAAYLGGAGRGCRRIGLRRRRRGGAGL